MFEVAETTPYINIFSVEPRSGKSRLIELLRVIVCKPWKTDNVTAASLYRKIEKVCPTLLLDEADATFKGDKKVMQAIRGILNSGYQMGGTVSRSVGVGTNWDVMDFSTFCPKAISGIGDLPTTVTDRCLGIELKRKNKKEAVEPFYQRDVREEVKPIVNRLEAWAEDNLHLLADARPDITFIDSDRAGDCWEPLLAIADLAGSEWSERAKRAAIVLSNGEEDDQSMGVRLLEDIHSVFQKVGTDRIHTADLIDELCEMEEAPWGDWKGKKIIPSQVSKLLKSYGVKPRNVRIGSDVRRGYLHEDFLDPWSRYTPQLSATTLQPESELEPTTEDMFGSANVADGNTPETPDSELNVADVATQPKVKAVQADDEVMIL